MEIDNLINGEKSWESDPEILGSVSSFDKNITHFFIEQLYADIYAYKYLVHSISK